MEIIFHKCEFVGEMMPLLDSRKVLYLAGYERIEAVLYNCIHHGQLPADLHTVARRSSCGVILPA